MGTMFFWMQNSPDAVHITQQKWTEMLDSMASLCIIAVIAAVILIVVFYAGSAKSKKIHKPEDIFAPYTPMYWLWLAAVAGLVVGCYCAWQYHDVFPAEAEGQASTSLCLAGWTALWAFILGYGLILLPGITPPKFRYRPLWLFYQNKGARRI
jgi:cytochrome bd-type quinol oxidase subunit 2